MTTTKALTYLRVSTDEQAASGLGLDAQRATLAQALKAREWRHVAELADEGLSGKDMRRPALTQALAMLDRGEADALVVAKLDRLSRSVPDFGRLMERAKRKGWAIVALDLGVDTSTPAGELVANVMASVAQWERQVIARRTSDALQAKKAKGARLGRPVTLDPKVRARIVRERKAGRSFQVIAEKLTADGIPTARGGRWHAETVRGIVGSVSLDAQVRQIQQRQARRNSKVSV